MSSNYILGVAISKKSAKLFKQGNSASENGLVHASDGKYADLIKPAVKSIANSAVNSFYCGWSAPVSMIFSSANNLQTDFAQAGINKANTRLCEIQKVLNSVDKPQLQWINTVFSAVSTGTSIIKAYSFLSELDRITSQIEELAKKEKKIFDKFDQDDYEKLNSYILSIKSGIFELNNYQSGIEDTRLKNFSDTLDEITAYLRRMVNCFMTASPEIRNFVLAVIMSIIPAFSYEIKAYSSVYYYKNGEFPDNYTKWTDAVSLLMDSEFKSLFKEFLEFDNNLTTQEKYAIYGAAVESVLICLGDIEYNKQLLQQISEKEYFNIDKLLEKKIKKINIDNADADEEYIIIRI